MKQKHSNSWHKTLYADHFAKSGLDSKVWHTQARQEVKFLAEYLNLERESKVSFDLLMLLNILRQK